VPIGEQEREDGSGPYALGDMLAMARQAWVEQMERRLGERGYGDYRRTDAAVARLLLRAPVPVGRLGAPLGVTRQAARKVAEGLRQRGYATLERDERDGRQYKVVLTPDGARYAGAVLAVIGELNRDVGSQVTEDQLAGADAVLRVVIGTSGRWSRTARVPSGPPAVAGGY
jgi:DNA-binding MarR family transcriptional regulator